MAQVFRDCCLNTYRQSGPPGLFDLWTHTLFDWFKTVIEEQSNRGTEMTRTKFIRLSGWGLVLAGISLLLSFLPAADQILAGLYQTFGMPTTPAQHDLYLSLTSGVRSLPFPVAILLITLGLFGMNIRYGARAGHIARLALGVGVVGGFASLVSWFWMSRPVTNIFIGLMFASLFVFGLVTLRVKPMRRGNGLPVLAGFWWPFLVIQAYVYPLMIRQSIPEVPFWLSFAVFSLMSLSLAWLGYVLQADMSQGEEIVLV